MVVRAAPPALGVALDAVVAAGDHHDQQGRGGRGREGLGLRLVAVGPRVHVPPPEFGAAPQPPRGQRRIHHVRACQHPLPLAEPKPLAEQDARRVSPAQSAFAGVDRTLSGPPRPRRRGIDWSPRTTATTATRPASVRGQRIGENGQLAVHGLLGRAVHVGGQRAQRRTGATRMIEYFHKNGLLRTTSPSIGPPISCGRTTPRRSTSCSSSPGAVCRCLARLHPQSPDRRVCSRRPQYQLSTCGSLPTAMIAT